MAAIVCLSVLTGPHRGTRFCLRRQNACLVGRATECQVRFGACERDLSISRRHCRIYFDPPMLHIQDLHSVNGTYINGRKVMDTAALAPNVCHIDVELDAARDGDVITVGGTSLQVNVVDCPLLGAQHDEESGWPADEAVLVDCPEACQHTHVRKCGARCAVTA
jgi:pSer/pThr/pTyr-binding forkhead associated (FHA) protein